MQYIAVMPHDKEPNPQLALWTMYVNWEPRCFFRVVPGSTYDEVVRTFLCHSKHWSDKLVILENRPYEVEEINALMMAPLEMQEQEGGIQILALPGNKTMLIRRDTFDILEHNGIRDNWFERPYDLVELARRVECIVGLYEPEKEETDASV